MRLIDADALLEYFKDNSNGDYTEWFLENIEDAIKDAPTVQREGWMSREAFVMSEYVNKDDLYRAMHEKIADQAATIAQPEADRTRLQEIKIEQEVRIIGVRTLVKELQAKVDSIYNLPATARTDVVLRKIINEVLKLNF
jgi:hypothetical protein